MEVLLEQGQEDYIRAGSKIQFYYALLACFDGFDAEKPYEQHDYDFGACGACGACGSCQVQLIFMK